MKLFVTVGLEAFPFERLVSAIESAVSDGLLDPDTFIQYGSSRTPVTAAAGSRYLSNPEMSARITDCDAVVAHAGVGTVMACRALNRVPILVPRRRSLGEHLDDHQCPFADMLEREGLAYVARGSGILLRDEIIRLARNVHEPEPDPSDRPLPGASLTAHLRTMLCALDAERS
ncbi:MAG: hypothetical protein JW733_04835 [Coriobacteriia bacterium]|nr:hypothetical protein [Coriobacteriia bacterium]MBN2840290.1 hypothetical protein [Coriobacteriia bacterium]